MSNTKKSLVNAVSSPRPEKIVRDVLRLEVAALLNLARMGKSTFAADLMVKASPEQRVWLRDEMKRIEQMLRIKVDCEDDA